MLATRTKKMIIASSLGALLLVGGGTWALNSSGFFDNRKIDTIENRVDSFIENKYTNSIKDDVKPSDVYSVQKDIDSIKDKSKRTRLKEKVQRIVEQAKLQSELKDKIEKYNKATKLDDVNIEDLQNAISKSQEILNVKVRNNLVKTGTEVLDRATYSKYVKSESEKITGDNPGLYYSVQGLNEAVAYPETKDEINKTLSEAKKKIDQVEKSADAQKNAKKNAAVQEAQKGSSYSFTKGSSTSTKMDSNEYQIFSKVSNNSNSIGQKFLGLDNGKVVVYTTENTSTGISVRQIITVEYTSSRISSPQVFNSFSVNSNTISAGSYIIGDSSSSDVVLSTNSLETLRNSLK